ncbi:MAG: TRAP transporter small permease subunit [Rhodospirillales bacterium]|nr:TRAP transporter small permease subunit [Rhodospirillales bacterium]
MRYLLRIEGILNSVATWVGRIGAWISVPLMIIIIFDVITRRFLVLGSTKLQEGEWHLHGALFLLCLGFAYLKHAHVRISLVHERFSPTTQRWIEFIGCLVFAIPYAAIVFYFAIDFVERSWSLNEASDSATGLPYRWAIKAFLPAGMLFLGLASIAVLLRKFIELFGSDEHRRAFKDESPERPTPPEPTVTGREQ